MKRVVIKLKRVLGHHKMTQLQLVELTGIRQPTISAMCNGHVKSVSIENMEKICNALDVPLSEWFFIEDVES